MDGFFTDFPGTGRQAVDQLQAEALSPQSRGELFGMGRPGDVLGIPNL